MSEKRQGKRGVRERSAPAKKLSRVLVHNISALLSIRYPNRNYENTSEQQKAFAKDAGVSWSTIQRYLDPEQGKTLDVLADIAVALEVKAHLLLDPHFAATVHKEVTSASKGVESERADAEELQPHSN